MKCSTCTPLLGVTNKVTQYTDRQTSETLFFHMYRCLCNLTRFLPRDAMHKRGLCCWSVSVRLSVTFAYCIQVAEDIVKFLSRPGSTVVLVSDSEHQYPTPSGVPNTRSGKMYDFRLKSPFFGNGTR